MGSSLLTARAPQQPAGTEVSPPVVSPLRLPLLGVQHVTVFRRRHGSRSNTAEEREKITCEASGDTLPGVFLWPVISASPVTGCSQVVLLASSLWRDRQTGGRQRQRQRGGGPVIKNTANRSQVGK